MTTRSGSVSDEDLRSAVERARRLTDGEAEPYRSIAFQTLLDYLINNRTSSGEPALRAETHPDRVLGIAFYQERYMGGPPVTARDLTDAYQRARLKRPQNFPDVIASLVRKGHLVEQGRRDGLKSWGLTGTGSARIERELS
jgi:hypothetical protein